MIRVFSERETVFLARREENRLLIYSTMFINFEKCDYSSKHDYSMDEVNETDSNTSSYLIYASKSANKRRSNGGRVSSIIDALSNRLHMSKKKKTRSFECTNEVDIQFGCFPGLRRGIPKHMRECNDNLTPWQTGSWDKRRSALSETDSSGGLGSGF